MNQVKQRESIILWFDFFVEHHIYHGGHGEMERRREMEDIGRGGEP